MIRLAHIIDDAGFGGVVRYLDTLKAALGPRIVHNRLVADTGRMVAPRVDADVIVLHATMAWRKLPFLISLRLRHRRCPIVLVEHSYTEAYERHHVARPARFRAMLRLAYRLADRVVAVSFGQAAWMRRARLLSAARLQVIPSFTDVAPLWSMALPPEQPVTDPVWRVRPLRRAERV